MTTGIVVLDAVAAFRKGAAIELVSSTQAGASTLCMEAAARFILPRSWQGAHVGGLDGVNRASTHIHASGHTMRAAVEHV